MSVKSIIDPHLSAYYQTNGLFF